MPRALRAIVSHVLLALSALVPHVARALRAPMLQVLHTLHAILLSTMIYNLYERNAIKMVFYK